MPRIPFARHSYRLDSLPASAQRLVNLYPELQPQDALSPVVVKSPPGTVEQATLGGAVFGFVTHETTFGEDVYAVTDGQYVTGQGWEYEIWRRQGTGGWARVYYTPGSLTERRTLIGAPAGPNGYPMFVLGSEAYEIDPTTATTVGGKTYLKKLNGTSGFPSKFSSCDWLDGYFLWADKDSGRWGVTSINDAGTADPLDFATAEAHPDPIRRLIVSHREVWIFGARSIEVWFNSGAADFPFERISGAYIERGAASTWCVAELDNAIFWLGEDGIVYRTEGYQPVRVSTHAIEAEISSFADLSTAEAFTFSHDGHAFYVLSFETENRTFVYDAATGLWHERATASDLYEPGKGLWRYRCAHRLRTPYTVFVDNQPTLQSLIFGDRFNGKLWAQDADVYTESGERVDRIATLPPLWGDTKRARMHRFEVEMETGGSAAAALKWSDDGGKTWSNTHSRSVSGDRVVWNRLGQFRHRIMELSFDTAEKVTLYAADTEATPGTS